MTEVTLIGQPQGRDGKPGKVAVKVKVINRYGDEVLKVYEVGNTKPRNGRAT